MSDEGFWTGDVLTVEENESMRDAAKVMLEKNVGSLLVVDDKKPVGIITEWDAVKVLAQGLDPNTSRVGDVMTRNPKTLKVTDDPEVAKDIMLDHGFSHMPVVDENNELVGIVTLSDLADSPDEVKQVRKIKFATKSFNSE